MQSKFYFINDPLQYQSALDYGICGDGFKWRKLNKTALVHLSSAPPNNMIAIRIEPASIGNPLYLLNMYTTITIPQIVKKIDEVIMVWNIHNRQSAYQQYLHMNKTNLRVSGYTY